MYWLSFLCDVNIQLIGWPALLHLDERPLSVSMVTSIVNMLPAFTVPADFISGLVKRLICICLFGHFSQFISNTTRNIIPTLFTV